MSKESFDAIITSPPYCNRYDYTRTYALELALLNIDEKSLVKLRQAMLSCTVENREKDLLAINPLWTEAIAATDEQELLQSILRYLSKQKALGKLNNMESLEWFEDISMKWHVSSFALLTIGE
jgi:DNA modification methylase